MNYKKFPKQDEVQQIGNMQLVTVTDENREHVLETIISMYTNEPCRICGQLITMQDMKNGAVFAGYSSDNKSRTAHKDCWESNTPKSKWTYPEDSNP